VSSENRQRGVSKEIETAAKRPSVSRIIVSTILMLGQRREAARRSHSRVTRRRAFRGDGTYPRRGIRSARGVPSSRRFRGRSARSAGSSERVRAAVGACGWSPTVEAPDAIRAILVALAESRELAGRRRRSCRCPTPATRRRSGP